MLGWRCYADSSQCSNVALEPTSCADTTLFTSSDIISLLLHRCSPAPTLSYLGFCLQQTRLIDNQQFVNFDLIDHDEVTDHDNWWSDPTLSYLGFCLQQTKLIDNQHQAITKCAKDLNPAWFKPHCIRMASPTTLRAAGGSDGQILNLVDGNPYQLR